MKKIILIIIALIFVVAILLPEEGLHNISFKGVTSDSVYLIFCFGVLVIAGILLYIFRGHFKRRAQKSKDIVGFKELN